MVSRLPKVGSDSGSWGYLLNDFLSVEHNSDGTLKKSAAISGAQPKTEKGEANGYAPLDAQAKLPITVMPDVALCADPDTGTAEIAGSFTANYGYAEAVIGGLTGQANVFSGLWLSQGTPDSNNYAVLGDETRTFFNTPAGDIGYIRCGNVDVVRFGDFSTVYPGLIEPMCFDIVQRCYITAATDTWAGLIVENDGTGMILDLRNSSQAMIAGVHNDGRYEGTTVNFGQTVGDKVSLYGNMLGNAFGYCYGVEANYGYHKAPIGHRWYMGSNADAGTSAYMELSNAGLSVKSGVFNIKTPKTPASANDTGTQGDICWDANYIYVCTATNTWKRTALSSW